MTRQTETHLLDKLNQGQQLTDHDLNKLSSKIGKGQTKSRGRDVAGITEKAYADNLSKLNPQQQQSVASAVKDYTTSSDTINTNCRKGNLDTTITRVDAALKTLKGTGAPPYRVCYRLMSFKDGAHVPYGAKTGNIIDIGDHVRDAAYVSASETRQFLVKGIKNPPPNTRYVKIVIVGRGGVNIAGGSPYTNQKMDEAHKFYHPHACRFLTADAGQAEILYERGTVFHIDKITAAGDDVHVVMSIPNNVPNNASIKDSYSGASVSAPQQSAAPSAKAIATPSFAPTSQAAAKKAPPKFGVKVLPT